LSFKFLLIELTKKEVFFVSTYMAFTQIADQDFYVYKRKWQISLIIRTDFDSVGPLKQ